MIPNQFDSRVLNLPKSTDHDIVIVTGCEDRHKRFALRLQEEFGESVKAWYEIDSDYPTVIHVEKSEEDRKNIKKQDGVIEKFKHSILEKGVQKTIKITASYLNNIFQNSKGTEDNKKNEDTFYREELLELQPYRIIKPKKIHPRDALSSEFILEIKKLNPYFLLTLGGVLHKEELLNSIRGVAINQHAGFSPDFKGSETHLWALYHRDLLKMSTTVHITKSGADDGPIIRRSTPCFSPNDTVKDMFNKIVVLGTELMVEIVHDIVNGKEILVYNQPKYVGRTCLSKEMTRKIKDTIRRDFNNNWLQMELKRLRSF